jgi:hypothetical protein
MPVATADRQSSQASGFALLAARLQEVEIRYIALFEEELLAKHRLQRADDCAAEDKPG